MRGKCQVSSFIASPGYIGIDEWGGVEVIATITGGVSGEILIDDIEFWDSTNARWVSSPPTLLIGSDIGFRVPVKNTSSSKSHMKLRVEVCRPGRTSGVTPEVYHSLDPGETMDFEFGTDFPNVYNFPSGDEEGDYTIIELILYADVY